MVQFNPGSDLAQLGAHRQGVGLMMNKEAARSCLGWLGINNRILIAHFMTKKFRVSVIAVYAPVEPTDGDTSDSDEFYLQLQEQIDRVPGRNMVFLLGDFHAQVGRNRDRWYPSLGKFGVGKENSNGYRLLQFYRYNNLVYNQYSVWSQYGPLVVMVFT